MFSDASLFLGVWIQSIRMAVEMQWSFCPGLRSRRKLLSVTMEKFQCILLQMARKTHESNMHELKINDPAIYWHAATKLLSQCFHSTTNDLRRNPSTISWFFNELHSGGQDIRRFLYFGRLLPKNNLLRNNEYPKLPGAVPGVYFFPWKEAY